jgi:hypothetical protein
MLEDWHRIEPETTAGVRTDAAHSFLDGVQYINSREFPLWGEADFMDGEGLLWLRNCEALRFHLYIDWFSPSRGETLAEQRAWDEDSGHMYMYICTGTPGNSRPLGFTSMNYNISDLQ